MTTPIKDKMTMTVANHLFSGIILKFDFPRILHSDSGIKFKSKLTENLSQQLGIRKTFISLTTSKQMETGVLTQIYQMLYLKIFCRWCS